MNQNATMSDIPDEFLAKAQRILSKDDSIVRVAQLLMKNANTHDELYALRKLANIGLMVECLGHQFNSTSSSIEHYLNETEGDSRFNYFKTKVNELIGYISYFNPLQVRYSNNYEVLTGAYLTKYLADFYSRCKLNVKFGDNLHNFKRTVSHSNFIPSICNIINNACYWSEQHMKIEHQVLVDMLEDGSIVIVDNGLGVKPEDVGGLFTYGFSRSRSGRGIGLYLSHLHFKNMGATLSYEKDTVFGLGGAMFKISFRN